MIATGFIPYRLTGSHTAHTARARARLCYMERTHTTRAYHYGILMMRARAGKAGVLFQKEERDL